jgi:hypothetical protein
MRTALGIATKRSLGLVVGNGRAPYGYGRVLSDKGKTIGYAPIEPEAGVVRRIADELTHDTLARVSERLNDERVPAPSGAASGSGVKNRTWPRRRGSARSNVGRPRSPMRVALPGPL